MFLRFLPILVLISFLIGCSSRPPDDGFVVSTNGIAKVIAVYGDTGFICVVVQSRVSNERRSVILSAADYLPVVVGDEVYIKAIHSPTRTQQLVITSISGQSFFSCGVEPQWKEPAKPK